MHDAPTVVDHDAALRRDAESLRTACLEAALKGRAAAIVVDALQVLERFEETLEGASATLRGRLTAAERAAGAVLAVRRLEDGSVSAGWRADASFPLAAFLRRPAVRFGEFPPAGVAIVSETLADALADGVVALPGFSPLAGADASTRRYALVQSAS